MLFAHKRTRPQLNNNYAVAYIARPRHVEFTCTVDSPPPRYDGRVTSYLVRVHALPACYITRCKYPEKVFKAWCNWTWQSISHSSSIYTPHRIIRNWYTWRWWVRCYIWYSEEGPGRAAAPPSPLLAVPNVTVHPSTASVYQSLYCSMTVRCSAVLKR